MKHFATVQVMELAGEIALLGKMRNAIYEHWRNKNAHKSPVESQAAPARATVITEPGGVPVLPGCGALGRKLRALLWSGLTAPLRRGIRF
ncbi:MAG: hypothetical protein V9H26_12915 [Verrucomicrobiota bacterium]